MRTTAALLLMSSMAIVAHGAYVYKIADGQCGESKISKRLVGFAVRFSHVKRGRCKDIGYTVHVGSTNQKNKSKFARNIKVELYTKPGENLCSAADMEPLSRACTGVVDPSSTSACGTPCEAAARQLHAKSCTAPGVGEVTIDKLLDTCSGFKKTSDVTGTKLVGSGKRCAIDYCKSNDCPKCADGLICRSATAGERCSGACFGTCQKEQIKCSTCAQLGWKPEGGGSSSVCAESDDGFQCQTNIVYSKAAETCALTGARLCTAPELVSGEGRGTGCGHDNRMIWSTSQSTDDLLCNFDERVVIHGTNRATAKCAKVSSNQASLRCCADTTCPISGVDGVWQGGSKKITDLAHTLLKLPNQFSTLVTAVKKANLLNTLEHAPGPFTVIAPTNQAFQDLDKKQPGTVARILNDKELLTRVLEYHIISGNVKSYELKDKMKVQNVIGETLSVSMDWGKVVFHGAQQSTGQVVFADLLATNGVAHGVSGVLIPPPIGGH